MELPVTLSLKASPSLGAALALAHGAVACGLVCSELPAGLLPALLAALAASLGWGLRQHVVRRPVSALRLKGDGTLDIVDAAGRWRSASLDAQTTAFRWLVVMSLRLDDRRLALALPPDALPADGHRQLRVWLNWKAASAGAASEPSL